MSGPWYQPEWNKHIVTPQCCEQARKTMAVYLAFHNRWDDESYNPQDENPLPGDDWEPYWVVRAYESWRPEEPWCLTSVTQEAKFCPFCGEAVPEVERVKAPGPVVRIQDGGYCCEECGERADSCNCLPPDVCWRVKPKGTVEVDIVVVPEVPADSINLTLTVDKETDDGDQR